MFWWPRGETFSFASFTVILFLPILYCGSSGLKAMPEDFIMKYNSFDDFILIKYNTFEDFIIMKYSSSMEFSKVESMFFFRNSRIKK